MNTNLISVCLYRDATGLYTEEECNRSNLEDFDIPEDILRLWHSKWFQNPFDEWLNEFTAEDTDGLYQFSCEHGFTPVPTGFCL